MLLMLLLLQHYPSWSELGHWKTPVKEMLKVNYCITFWLMVKLEKCIWYVAYHFFGCYALFSSKMVFKMCKRSEHIHFNSEYIFIHISLMLIHFTLFWFILTLILIHFTFLFWTLFWHKTWCLTGCRCFALSYDSTMTFHNLSFFSSKREAPVRNFVS